MRLLPCTLFLCLVSLATISSAQVNFNYTYYEMPSQGLATVSADFNRDGIPDVAVATNGGFEVFLGTQGGAAFGIPQNYDLSFDPLDMVAADVNGDGWPDIVMLSDNEDVALVYLNNGDGTFRYANSFRIDAGSWRFISAGDLNNDGKVDLVVSELVGDGSTGQFAVFLGNGNGTFTRGPIIPVAGPPSRAVLYDLNRDGKLDLAAAVTPNANIFWGNGDGTFSSSPLVIPASDANGDQDLTVADFNNDANPDLAIETSQFCGSACGTNTVYTYLGNGAGAFTLKSSFIMNNISAGGNLYVGDLNDDQNMDVLINNQEHFGGGLAYALGDGHGNFGTQGALVPLSDTSSVVVRDFNLDSRPDLVVSTWMGDGFNLALNTSAYVNCAPPDSSHLQSKICVPASGAHVSNPITVRASGNAPVGVKRMEIWVDGHKLAQELNSQIAKVINLSPGQHTLSVIAVDQYVGYVSKSETITVQ